MALMAQEEAKDLTRFVITFSLTILLISIPVVAII